MSTYNPCAYCRSPFCKYSMACYECRGAKVFIGAFIGGEPNYYGLQHPANLPCRVCGGTGHIAIICPYYSYNR